MRAWCDQDLQAFFEAIACDYDVRVPIRLPDGTRALGRPGEGPLSLCGGPLPRKITAVFFPQCEAILGVEAFKRGSVEASPASTLPRFHASTLPRIHASTPSPLFVVGWTAADLDCLAFIDKFFGTGYRDTVYFRKRADAVIVGVSGWGGEQDTFQRIAGANCDFELIRAGSRHIARPYSERGRKLVSAVTGGEECEDAVLEELLRTSQQLAREDRDLLAAASRLLLEDRVPEPFWQKIADRCIACTACNLACPTCTCFDVFDRGTTGDGLRRWRLWDSCQLDGFAREASGYNPMGEPRVRAHRRIHHKLAADVLRWGHITCFLCGRCDRVCPTGIGMMAVCREMVQEYGQ